MLVTSFTIYIYIHKYIYYIIIYIILYKYIICIYIYIYRAIISIYCLPRFILSKVEPKDDVVEAGAAGAAK